MRGPAPLEGDSPSCAVASCFWLRTPPRVPTRSKGPGPRVRAASSSAPGRSASRTHCAGASSRNPPSRRYKAPASTAAPNRSRPSEPRADDVRWNEIAALYAPGGLLPTPVCGTEPRRRSGTIRGSERKARTPGRDPTGECRARELCPVARRASRPARTRRTPRGSRCSATRALELTRAPPERRHLARRLESLMGCADPQGLSLFTGGYIASLPKATRGGHQSDILEIAELS